MKPAITLLPIDDLDRAIVTLAARINAETYELLVLIRQFDERAGWLKWGLGNCAQWLHYRCGLRLSRPRHNRRWRVCDVANTAALANGNGRASLPIESVKRLCCDGHAVVIGEDENGEPLNIGRKTRTVPTAIKRALEARDKCCAFPGSARQADALVSMARAYLSGTAGQTGNTSDDYLVTIHVDQSALAHANDTSASSLSAPTTRVIARTLEYDRLLVANAAAMVGKVLSACATRTFSRAAFIQAQR